MAIISNSIGQQVMDILGLDDANGPVQSVSIKFETQDLVRVEVVIQPNAATALSLVEISGSESANRRMHIKTKPDTTEHVGRDRAGQNPPPPPEHKKPSPPPGPPIRRACGCYREYPKR